MSIIRKCVKSVQKTPAVVAICLFFIVLISHYGPGSFSSGEAEIDSNVIKTSSEFETPLVTVQDDENADISGTKTKERKTKSPEWTYICLENSCIRKEVANSSVLHVSFEVCWLTCGSHGALWPYPSFQKRKGGTVKIHPENIELVEIKAASEPVRRLITDAFQIKQRYFNNHPSLQKRSESRSQFFSWPFSNFFSESSKAIKNEIKVFISTNQTEEVFTLGTDETYEINIFESGYFSGDNQEKIQLNVEITGSTFFGVRHGIETFSQLLAFDSVNNCFQIVRNYYAHDKPFYPYRGILVDVARNFIPLEIIKRVIDGMALNKLNILHIHLSDSNTFPFYSKRVPQMTEYGTIYPHQVYRPEELRDIVQYAQVRGVKVIPELDAPSHAGNGWQFGEKEGLGKLAFYINDYDDLWTTTCGQPPCGIVNPLNANTYDVLEKLYADMLDVFDNDMFHMGGDEVNLNSWKRQAELREWLKGKNELELWNFFQTEALKRLRSNSPNVTAILWTSHLTSSSKVTTILNPKDYIMQVWEPSKSSDVKTLLSKGYSIIISFVDKLYLDWGGGTWLGKNHMWNYSPWQRQYDVNRDLFQHSVPKTPSQKQTIVTSVRNKQILGAEVALWSEKVGPYDLETRLWPRAAAFAESFWSNPKLRNEEVYNRINYHNHRMGQYGIPTNQLQPESCMHFNGHCKNPLDVI